VERNTLLWAMVVFFGATVLFGAIGNATEDESTAVRIGLQAGAGLLLIAGLVAFVRGTRR
jgi:hypothetical protein